MITEYKWVTREPMCEHCGDEVCQWVLTLRCFAWAEEKTEEPEAVAFATETIPCSVCKGIEGYTKEQIEIFSEAIRRVRKWDKFLTDDVTKQLQPKVTIPGWNNDTLQIDS